MVLKQQHVSQDNIPVFKARNQILFQYVIPLVENLTESLINYISWQERSMSEVNFGQFYDRIRVIGLIFDDLFDEIVDVRLMCKFAV